MVPSSSSSSSSSITSSPGDRKRSQSMVAPSSEAPFRKPAAGDSALPQAGSAASVVCTYVCRSHLHQYHSHARSGQGVLHDYIWHECCERETRERRCWLRRGHHRPIRGFSESGGVCDQSEGGNASCTERPHQAWAEGKAHFYHSVNIINASIRFFP